MIRVENLGKRYGERAAVRNLSFSVAKGEVIGFLGPNGAGKSTTLRMITGFITPTTGTISVDGIDALEHPVEARRRIGYMPEAVPLYPEMRVNEYLRYRAELKAVPRAQMKKSIDAALEKAKVTDVQTRIIGQLSKGYKQRVGLADALVADPKILILDEPTAGLDPNQIREVRDLIRALAGEKTVLLSTHILPEVEAACGRVLILHQGKLVAEGPTDQIRKTLHGSASTILVMSGRGVRAAFEDAVRGVEGVRRVLDAIDMEAGIVRLRLETEPNADVGARVFSAVAKAGLALHELRSDAVSLEDVFAELTTADAAASDAPPASPTPPATTDTNEVAS